jgi:hypothetical protein
MPDDLYGTYSGPADSSACAAGHMKSGAAQANNAATDSARTDFMVPLVFS